MITTTVRPTRARRAVLISAAAVPLLIVGQFAMLAIVPVAIAVIAGARIRGVRLWTWLLGALYATPLVVWALRTDPAQSLSKDIHPALLTAVVVASIAFLFAVYSRSKK